MKKVMMVMTMVALLAVVGCKGKKPPMMENVTTTESVVTEQTITPVAITEEAVATTQAGM